MLHKTPEQVAADTRERWREELLGDAAALREHARPGRARTLAPILRDARGAEFGGELDAQLLTNAGYTAHEYCTDLFIEPLKVGELRDFLVGHSTVSAAERLVVGTERVLMLGGISRRLAEGLRRLPFPPSGEGYGAALPALRELARRGYGEYLPRWMLDFAHGRPVVFPGEPVHEDPSGEPQDPQPVERLSAAQVKGLSDAARKARHKQAWNYRDTALLQIAAEGKVPMKNGYKVVTFVNEAKEKTGLRREEEPRGFKRDALRARFNKLTGT